MIGLLCSDRCLRQAESKTIKKALKCLFIYLFILCIVLLRTFNIHGNVPFHYKGSLNVVKTIQRIFMTPWKMGSSKSYLLKDSFGEAIIILLWHQCQNPFFSSSWQLYSLKSYMDKCGISRTDVPLRTPWFLFSYSFISVTCLSEDAWLGTA